MFSVTTVALPGVNGVGAKVTVVPAGTPVVAVSTIGVLKPPVAVVPRFTVGVAGAGHATVVGVVVLNVKPATAAEMVKLVLEISKKILPIDSTLILAVVLGVFGIFTDSLPSFGVLAISTVGKVKPPSVDNKIRTLAQLTGAAVVLFTDHCTVCVLLPGQLTLVFGVVTANGPELLVTVTVISVNAVWPTLSGAVELYGELSLTVSLKLSVLETLLNASISTPGSPPGNAAVV